MPAKKVGAQCVFTTFTAFIALETTEMMTGRRDLF